MADRTKAVLVGCGGISRAWLTTLRELGDVDGLLSLLAPVGDEPTPGNVGGKVEKVGRGERAGHVVAPATGRGQADVAGKGRRTPGDDLLFGGLTGAGAGDGPGRAPDPALVPLAELVPVAAPGHVAEIAAVVADHVDFFF